MDRRAYPFFFFFFFFFFIMNISSKESVNCMGMFSKCYSYSEAEKFSVQVASTYHLSLRGNPIYILILNIQVSE